MQHKENFSEPSREGDKKKLRQIVIVDNSDMVDDKSRDIADAKLTAPTEEVKGIKNTIKRIWKYNIAKSYYQKKETHKAKNKILETGNIFADENNGNEHHEKLNQVLIEKFLSEEAEAIHSEAGDKREILGNSEADQAIQAKIKDLVMDYVSGKLTDETFPEEKSRVFNELKGVKNDVIGKGIMYADNVFEIAKEFKRSIEHGARLEDLDFNFEVVIGKSKSGARTEVQYDAVDKLTSKIMDSKCGHFFNETSVSLGLAAVFSLGAAASKRFASSKAAAIGSFGFTAVLGGGIAAVRERKMLEDDRRQHFREMAQGKSFEDVKSPRRKKMEEYRYETRDANLLFDDLDESLYDYDKDGKPKLKKEISTENLQQAFGHLVEMEARIILSDKRKIDLISYSDEKNLDRERLSLDLLRAKAKVDFRACAGSEEMKKILNGKSVDDFLASLTETRMKQLVCGENGIEK